ncbi:MAG: hypothetical protein R3E75_09880 [Steroidobacteraceae bacterium]|nr:hypothetical protein [Nevskiaceae bacterium]MCP5339514.1 hypothetical protein [Nevskiaceae bacterium]MCP5359195.1 hypothetical protein [Nevskiaceae bacterium]MCP5466428.1 hypothetical protein [Nevskiaceae bacterium]MCP5471870.1 hypothetical protein [Nevskiaceae bacterium]
MTALEEAELAGIDLSLIEVGLDYSYDQRALQHQAALELALELERVGRQLRGATESPDRTPV